MNWTMDDKAKGATWLMIYLLIPALIVGVVELLGWEQYLGRAANAYLTLATGAILFLIGSGIALDAWRRHLFPGPILPWRWIIAFFFWSIAITLFVTGVARLLPPTTIHPKWVIYPGLTWVFWSVYLAFRWIRPPIRQDRSPLDKM